MLLEINAKIFYPSHGAGWVIDEKTIEFCGEKKSYFEFQFINNPLTISTPVNNISQLNIRTTNPPKEIRKIISILKDTPEIKPPFSEYNAFIQMIKELDCTGELENFVKIIQYCTYVKKQREEEKRVIPTNITNHIKTAREYLISELSVAEGIDFEEGEKIFETLTS